MFFLFERGKPPPRFSYAVMAGHDPPSSRIFRYPFLRGLRRHPRNALGFPDFPNVGGGVSNFNTL